MHYEKITTEILEKLKAIVGPKNVVTDADAMQPYSHDEVTDPAYHHMPEAVVFAETAQQVSAIIKLANACHFPVVPRGAGTGLACGAVPEYGGLVLSLEKMNKIISREYPEASRETLLVLDATTGKNAVSQAKEFGDVADITGIVLTKLDGTAKGGIAITVADEFDMPVKFIGVGEGIEDLMAFDPAWFIGGIFDE